MKGLHPAAKVGVVLGGLVVAFVAAGLAMKARELAMEGSAAQASAGMSAFGDLLLGIAVFCVISLVPLALALYWLRAVPRFWSIFAWVAVVYIATGPIALLISGHLREMSAWLTLATDARIGSMPLTALTLAICSFFAPQVRQRWLLIALALTDGALFAGLVVIKVILPRIHP